MEVKCGTIEYESHVAVLAVELTTAITAR